jgi:hypothetical protein
MNTIDSFVMKSDLELLRIYESALIKCCMYCHSISNDLSYRVLHVHYLKNGNKVTVEQLNNCSKCDYVKIGNNSFVNKFCG